MKKKVLTYIISLVAAFLLWLIIFFIHKGNSATEKELYTALCDSFFATGTIYLCVGLLFFVSNLGIFDMLSFGLLKLLDLFKKDVKDTKYANYIEFKEAKKESYIEWKHLAIIGIIFIIIAGIFLYLYEK